MKALLSVSFGTTFVDTRQKTIDIIDKELAATFPDREFFSAWTSNRIIRKVRERRGEHHNTLTEAFQCIEEAGVDDLVVATMCLMQGAEMKKIEDTAQAWAAAGNRRVRVAAPLLASADDRKVVAETLVQAYADIPTEDALLLMGHGSEFGGNEVYAELQETLHQMGHTRYFVSTVEGVPTFEDTLPSVLDCGAKTIHLAPLMIVAGDHARNDLAGESDESWASVLQAHGLQTQLHLVGLGEYPAIRKLACEHAKAAK